jgi:hypothetical protein
MAAAAATEDVWVRQETLQQQKLPAGASDAVTNNNVSNPTKVFSRKPLKKPPLLEFEDLKYTVPLGLNRGASPLNFTTSIFENF